MDNDTCKNMQELDSDGRKSVAASLLAVGKSVTSVAEAVSVNPATVHRWLALPEFRALVSAHRSSLLGEALGRLVSLASAAVVTLGKSLASDVEGNRLKAATAILDRLMTMREQGELAERLAELEAKVEQAKKGSKRWG